MQTRYLMCSVLLIAAAGSWGNEDLEGSAFVGRGPTAAELELAQARVETAERYVECIATQRDGTWFGKADFSVCDGAREAYATTLAADVANAAIGCLEERWLGSPRVAGMTCAALHARFSTGPVVKLDGAQP